MRTKRARARGAAMVEGILVMATLLVFLGLIVGARNAYATKLDVQQTSRSNVLYYASHACQGNQGSNNTQTGSIMPGPGGNAAPANGAQQGTSSWNVASNTGSTTSSWMYIADQNAGNPGGIALGKSTFSSNVSWSSYCVCNEQQYNSQLTAWFKFGISMVKNLGGFSAMFSLAGGN
jgi:hypothetical protein